jgi:hypothetical protein
MRNSGELPRRDISRARHIGVTEAMPRVPYSQRLRLSCGDNFLMTPDKHRVAAALLRNEAADLGDAKAATLAILHDVFAVAIQLRIDEQCPPTAPA